MTSIPSTLRTDVEKLLSDRVLVLTIVVSALGYFVDIFDLLLFSIVRMQSLKDIGVPDAELLSTGVFLINMQMAGLLIGGFIWGVIGDKIGRLSVLFASILLYSVANILNGFVHSVESYAILRFIGGFGLAGELGLCVTLVSELLPKTLRGLGTTFIASVGVLGATFAAIINDMFGWRDAYIIGGVMGLCLLALRFNLRESVIFKHSRDLKTVRHGSLKQLFTTPRILKKYMAVILVGAPLWAVVGILITFSPEFAKAFGMAELPKAGTAVLFCYAGLAVGDLGIGLISQYLKSRKKAIFTALCFLSVTTIVFVKCLYGATVELFYATCFVLGLGAGYWAMFVQLGAEHFGTNLRATTATSIPNVVRGLTIPMTAAFQAMIPYTGLVASGMIVMTATLMISFTALNMMAETYTADLDYNEQ